MPWSRALFRWSSLPSALAAPPPPRPASAARELAPCWPLSHLTTPACSLPSVLFYFGHVLLGRPESEERQPPSAWGLPAARYLGSSMPRRSLGALGRPVHLADTHARGEWRM